MMKRRLLKSIEYEWRQNVVYPLFRRLFHNPEIKCPIDLQRVKSVLFLRYDRIGDMIVTTPVFEALKAVHPALKIGVVASSSNAEIIFHNPFVDTIHILPSRWWKVAQVIRKARREQYDVVVNLIFNRTTSGGVLANLIAPTAVKVGQGDQKYTFYFNVLLRLSRTHAHMLETISSMIRDVFGIHLKMEQVKYSIWTTEEVKQRVSTYLSLVHLKRREEGGMELHPYCVFNLSAHDQDRRISADQACAIGKFLSSQKSFKTIILHGPGDSAMKTLSTQLCSNTSCVRFPVQGNASLLEIAALIEGALFVITPDTSIVHFASAGNTPVLGFYTDKQEFTEWLPLNVPHRIVLSQGHQPVSAIPETQMVQEIKTFIHSLSPITSEK